MTERRQTFDAIRAEEAKKSEAINKAAAAKKGTYWAAGTGYGFGGDGDDDAWDDDGNVISKGAAAVRAESARKAEAKLMAEVRQRITRGGLMLRSCRATVACGMQLACHHLFEMMPAEGQCPDDLW